MNFKICDTKRENTYAELIMFRLRIMISGAGLIEKYDYCLKVQGESEAHNSVGTLESSMVYGALNKEKLHEFT